MAKGDTNKKSKKECARDKIEQRVDKKKKGECDPWEFQWWHIAIIVAVLILILIFFLWLFWPCVSLKKSSSDSDVGYDSCSEEYQDPVRTRVVRKTAPLDSLRDPKNHIKASDGRGGSRSDNTRMKYDDSGDTSLEC